MADSTIKTSSPALIAAAWLIVVAPTAWGLTYTVQNALKLFRSNPPASTAPASAAVPAAK